MFELLPGLDFFLQTQDKVLAELLLVDDVGRASLALVDDFAGVGIGGAHHGTR